MQVTSLWSKHTWFRRTISTLAIVLTVCLVVLLSIAYVYMPPEDRTHTPAYLRWMQARHLDHYVEAGSFRLHYLHEGSGEAVVLLPGVGAWIYDLRDVIAALAPHYAVYAIDEPGDGYTTPLAQNPDYSKIYTLDSIDESLLAFLNCAGYFGYTFSKKAVNSKVSNSFASCVMERWRVKEYENTIGTGILE